MGLILHRKWCTKSTGDLHQNADEGPNLRALSLVVLIAGDAAEEALWVDQYSPRSFLELLSDEAINRAVVKWLKSWDAAVFGTGQTPAATGGAAGRVPMAGQRGKATVDRRPAQRVLLMGGPPGDDTIQPHSS